MPVPPPDDSKPDTVAFVPTRPGLRWLLLGAGFACVGLGIAGAILPVLPTTPLLLVAAACFARSSRRWHQWLLGNRVFGKGIRDYHEHRAVPRRARNLAITFVILTLGSSIVFAVANPFLQGVLAAIGAGVVWFLCRLPVLEEAE